MEIKIDHVCSRLQRKARSVSAKTRGNGKQKISKSKENGLMNTSLNSDDYVLSLKMHEDNRERVYGMENRKYEEILDFCKVDQVDYSKPNLQQAIKTVDLINKEGKSIRRKYKKASENTMEFNKEENNHSQKKMDRDTAGSHTKNGIFEQKKIVIKNPGFKLKERYQDDVLTPSTVDKNLKKNDKINLIPLIAKAFRKFRQLKKSK